MGTGQIRVPVPSFPTLYCLLLALRFLISQDATDLVESLMIKMDARFAQVPSPSSLTKTFGFVSLHVARSG